jgi:hypothetical protein
MQGKEKHANTRRAKQSYHERQELDKYAPPHHSPSFSKLEELKCLAHPRIKTFSSRLSCYFALLTARSRSRLPITGTLSCSKPNSAPTSVPKRLADSRNRIERTCTTRVFAERYVEDDCYSAFLAALPVNHFRRNPGRRCTVLFSHGLLATIRQLRRRY